MRLLMLLVAGIIAVPGAPAQEAGAVLDVPAWAEAPEPGRWQWIWINRVAEFREENARLDPGRRTIVFLGDSLTQGFRLESYFPGLPVLNRGIVSDGLADFPAGRNIWRGVTRRLKESVFDCRPSHVFFLIGTNDVGVTDIPLDYWMGVYRYAVGRIQREFPDVVVIPVTCPPSGARYGRHERLNARILEWNTFLRSFAREKKFRFIDLHALLVGEDDLMPEDLSRDGLHFNRTCYERFADEVRRILTEDGVGGSPHAAEGPSKNGPATPQPGALPDRSESTGGQRASAAVAIV